MRTIGLIGGMSWESSAEYYRLINQQVRDRLGPLRSAQILMYSVDFGPVEQAQHAGRWDDAAAILVEFVPDVMGSAGQISLAVMGLTAARYGSISLVGLPGGEWQWRKTNGLKDPDTFVFDANFLALQLQSLIPRDRG